MGHGRLGEIEQRHELAYADLASMLAQDVNQLYADGVSECFGDLGDAARLVALDVGVNQGLAAALTGWPLDLRGQFQFDNDPYIYID